MGMMRYGYVAFAAGALALAPRPAHAQDQDRLYGQVRTASGEVYEGYIRWDRNEGGWVDLLDGSKELDQELLASVGEEDESSRERSVEFLGVRISWEEDDDLPSSAEAGLRFGHLRSLRVTGDDRAMLTLKSGEKVELFGGSTDLGDDMRELVIDDPSRDLVELAWRDLDRIDFMAVPAGAPAPRSRRLYGTTEDRWGNRYTGYLAWDLDEILGSDILDGEERGHDRDIPFDRIEGIERESSRSARVFLRGGEEVVLTGTNDVGEGHRGVQISDPALGQVDVGWDELASVRFQDPPPAASLGADYDAFGRGWRLRGTVETEDGERYSGQVVWDVDESWSWEILDGNWRDESFDIELGKVDRIEKRSSRSAEVTLLDGRSFELEGSNDVDRTNKGIVVELDDGGRVVVDWERFRSVTFERP